MELMKEFRFEASHILPKHPGKCSRLHGHSWVLKVYVKGEIDPETGFVMDYVDIKKVVQPIVDAMDHRHLGQGGTDIIRYKMWQEWSPAGMNENFYPSSENLLIWIAGQLWPLNIYLIQTPQHQQEPYKRMALRDEEVIEHEQDLAINVSPLTQWSRIELNETCTSSAILTREEFNNETARKLVAVDITRDRRR